MRWRPGIGGSVLLGETWRERSLVHIVVVMVIAMHQAARGLQGVEGGGGKVAGGPGHTYRQMGETL